MDKNELHLAETIVIGAEPGGYGEIVMEAAEVALESPIHIVK
ncbi:hypothetical protein AB1L05_10465 [Cytobacillus horneckiae]